MKLKGFMTAVVVAGLMSACDGSEQSNPQLNAEQQALNNNKSLWQRSNLSSYQFILRQQCFCAPGGDIVITVINGRVAEAFRSPAGTYLSPQELGSVFPIEGLFGKVQEAIDHRVFTLRVTYNASLGYPESISIDGSQQIADDEVTYTARSLQ